MVDSESNFEFLNHGVNLISHCSPSIPLSTGMHISHNHTHIYGSQNELKQVYIISYKFSICKWKDKDLKVEET